MQKCKCYITASAHFLENITNINTRRENAIPVLADFVGLYPSIAHQADF